MKKFILIGAVLGSMFSIFSNAQTCTGQFQEKDELLVLEAESFPISDSWVLESDFTGFTGTGYYRWNGSDEYGGANKGKMTISFDVTNAGLYKVLVHNHRFNVPGVVPADHENDIYIKINDGDYTKFHTGQYDWNWQMYPTVNHEGVPNEWQLNEGVNTISVAGRSHNFMFDRIVLAKKGTADLISTNLELRETNKCAEPEITFNSPINNGTIEEDETITLSVDVTSEFTIEKVEFYLYEDLLLGTVTEPPYEIEFLNEYANSRIRYLDFYAKAYTNVGSYGWSPQLKLYQNDEEVTTTDITSENHQSIVYPNPCQGVLNLQQVEGYTQFKIIDITGSILMQSEIQNNSETINLQHLQNGMYILLLEGNENTSTTNFNIIH